jgi:hypothetical protein
MDANRNADRDQARHINAADRIGGNEGNQEQHADRKSIFVEWNAKSAVA